MLQQTQTSRVVPKYIDFVKTFPTVSHLAEASFIDVLKLWQGLGYNRRALYLKNAAEIITGEYNGLISRDVKTLASIKGIGINTAGAVIAFAYNLPVVFIETNIRRVYIHYFFKDLQTVTDKQILELVKITLPESHIRNWYYALMDHGAHLSKITTNPNRKSKNYAKQSKFEGSQRQMRGIIIRELLTKELTLEELKMLTKNSQINRILEQLVTEKLIVKRRNRFVINNEK